VRRQIESLNQMDNSSERVQSLIATAHDARAPRHTAPTPTPAPAPAPKREWASIEEINHVAGAIQRSLAGSNGIYLGAGNPSFAHLIERVRQGLNTIGTIQRNIIGASAADRHAASEKVMPDLRDAMDELTKLHATVSGMSQFDRERFGRPNPPGHYTQGSKEQAEDMARQNELSKAQNEAAAREAARPGNAIDEIEAAGGTVIVVTEGPNGRVQIIGCDLSALSADTKALMFGGYGYGSNQGRLAVEVIRRQEEALLMRAPAPVAPAELV
jgi:hypothetical protein